VNVKDIPYMIRNPDGLLPAGPRCIYDCMIQNHLCVLLILYIPHKIPSKYVTFVDKNKLFPLIISILLFLSYICTI
jgi:hypothetical protein